MTAASAALHGLALLGLFALLCGIVWGGGFYLERRGVPQGWVVWLTCGVFAAGVFLIGRLVELWK